MVAVRNPRKPCEDLEMWKMFANFADELKTYRYGRRNHSFF